MALKRRVQDNPLIKVTSAPLDLTRYTTGPEEIERRWLLHWAPKYRLDPALTGKERALAMARSTNMTKTIRPRPILREPGDDFEEDQYR